MACLHHPYIKQLKAPWKIKKPSAEWLDDVIMVVQDDALACTKDGRYIDIMFCGSLALEKHSLLFMRATMAMIVVQRQCMPGYWYTGAKVMVAHLPQVLIRSCHYFNA